MTHLLVLFGIAAVFAYAVLLATWWLERSIESEPVEDRSRGTLADWPR